MNLLQMLLLFLLCYAIGNLPSAYLIAKSSKNIDIRSHGSGNPGATNVFRTVSKAAGIATLFIDVAKGFIPVFAARKLYPASSIIPPVCGLLAVSGHCWPALMGFKGGKGVATGTGAAIALVPFATLLGFAAFAIVFAASGYVSLGSITAAALLATTCWALAYPVILSSVVTLIAAVIIYKHKPNISRLLNHTEQKTKLVKNQGK